ncbi:MAG: (deoxy)nucleoside triphosphate pyrophosphohydrolase [Cellulomonadaceae bacterium]|nr:(deoxy)nucleoside triphosphate pyrophosphohydrolase [Cellulomonadaceae bacterium]
MNPVDQPQLVVAVALVDDLDAPRRLLSARRSKPVNLAGRWEFPGGKADHGETPEQAVHREVLEELGVTVTLGAEVRGPDAAGWRISDRYVMRLWAATLLAGEPQPLVEHDELRWLDAGQWFSVPWLDPDVPILEALQIRAAHPSGLR